MGQTMNGERERLNCISRAGPVQALQESGLAGSQGCVGREKSCPSPESEASDAHVGAATAGSTSGPQPTGRSAAAEAAAAAVQMTRGGAWTFA